jgi:hypothetical protein
MNGGSEYSIVPRCDGLGGGSGSGSKHGSDWNGQTIMTPATPRKENRCTGTGGGDPQELFLPFGRTAIMVFAVCHVAAFDRAV